jgi:transcriptional regulator with PAS, ATPase and Fis domain
MRERLREVREELLRLHTVLLADQRNEYEQMYGRVQTSGEMLNLVMSHEWFAWLRALSSLIVRMDELLDAKEFSDADAKVLIEYTRALAQPAEEGAIFRQKYHAAIQRNPDVLIGHGRLKKVLAE